jgi:hypothetical protein
MAILLIAQGYLPTSMQMDCYDLFVLFWERVQH